MKRRIAEPDWNYTAWTTLVDAEKAKVSKLEEENAKLREQVRKLESPKPNLGQDCE